MKVSVVIPQYKHYELLHQVLWDLYKFCKDDIYEIIVVDDASNDDTLNSGIMWWKSQDMLPIKVFQNKHNLGFLKTCNRGVLNSSGDIIILLSNDVRILDNVVKQVKEVIETNERTLVGNRLIDWDSGWNTVGGRIHPYLEGWFLACSEKVWKELGGFDEQYSPSDFEDVDISTTAIANGIALVSLDNSRVTHTGAQSIGYNPEREAITRRNKERFAEKWMKTT